MKLICESLAEKYRQQGRQSITMREVIRDHIPSIDREYPLKPIPVTGKTLIEMKRYHTMTEISEMYGVSKQTLQRRINAYLRQQGRI